MHDILLIYICVYGAVIKQCCTSTTLFVCNSTDLLKWLTLAILEKVVKVINDTQL